MHRAGRDLVERLKKDPKSISIGFATALGSHNHIGAGLLMKAIGGEAKALKAIAFKGSAEAITALLGGHIEILVNNAAAAIYQPLATFPLKRRKIMFEANVHAPLDLAQAAIPAMRAAGVAPAGLSVHNDGAFRRPP